MKKLVMLLLVVMMSMTFTACGNKDDEPNNDKENQVVDNNEQQEQENDTNENEASQAELSVPEVLALYGFNEELLKPEEEVINVTSEKRYTGGYKVSFEVDAQYPNGYTYMENIYNAIQQISDDGKVYALTEEFLNGTASEVPLDEVEVYQNRFTLCYVYQGVQLQVETSIVSIPSGAIVLNFSSNN